MLQRKVQAGQQKLRAWAKQGDGNSAGFAGALTIVRNGKLFTGGNYDKTFMLDVTKELFNGILNKDKIIKSIKDISLSVRSIHDLTIMMAHQVEETKINAGIYFSLTLDESTDVSNLSHFSIVALYAATHSIRKVCFANERINKRGRYFFFRIFYGFYQRKKKNYQWINLFLCILMVLPVCWGKTKDL